MLDSVDLKVRLSKATELVDRHLQSIHVAEKITQKVEDQLSKSKKEFLLRQQMRAIKKELGDNGEDEDDVAALGRKMQSAGMPSNIWKHAQRFGEVAELLLVCWLEIRGKIDMRMLSPSTMYKAYLVFKLTSDAYGFKNSPVVVTVGLDGGESERFARVGAQHPKERADGWLEVELGEFSCKVEEYGELEMDCMEINSSWGKRGFIVIVKGIEVSPKRM